MIKYLFPLLLLTACDAQRDMGGNIDDYADAADAAKSMVHISGTCVSACTIKLGSAHGACVEPDAILGFHSAYNWARQQHGGPWAGMDPFGNVVLLHYYDKFPKLELKATKMLESPEVTYLTAKELIALGVPACPH